MRRTAGIADVVASHLCTSCGTCAGICPCDALSMRETPGGLLLPAVDEAKCSGCALCARVCPGAHPPLEILQEARDPYEGVVRSAWLAQSRNPSILAGAQSGGFVSELLLQALRSGMIDGAILTRFQASNPLRPEVFVARTEEEILAARKSKYCPTPVGAILKAIASGGPQRLAFVGLGCHMQGLELAGRARESIRRAIAIRIGLFCDRVLTYRAMDYLVRRSGVARESVTAFTFKDKRCGGYPGDVSVADSEGKIGCVDSKERTQYCNLLFTPVRCRLCFDKWNVYADLAAGDAWGLYDGKDGMSAVLARTETGEEFRSIARDAMTMNPVAPEEIFRGQEIGRKRKLHGEYMQAWRKLGYRPPELGTMIPESASAALGDRVRASLTLKSGLLLQGRLGAVPARRRLPNAIVRVCSLFLRYS